MFLFANPVFIYFMSFLFNKDSTGSIITRIVYIMFGGLCPLTVSILLLVPSTVEYGKVFKWVFFVAPIYSLNIGIQNISK